MSVKCVVAQLLPDDGCTVVYWGGTSWGYRIDNAEVMSLIDSSKLLIKKAQESDGFNGFAIEVEVEVSRVIKEVTG